MNSNVEKILKSLVAMRYPIYISVGNQRSSEPAYVTRVLSNYFLLQVSNKVQTAKEFAPGGLTEGLKFTLICDIENFSYSLRMLCKFSSEEGKSWVFKYPSKIEVLNRRKSKRVTLAKKDEYMAVQGKFLSTSVDLDKAKVNKEFPFIIENISETGVALMASKALKPEFVKSFDTIDLTFKVIPGVSIIQKCKVVAYGDTTYTQGGKEYPILRAKFVGKTSPRLIKWIDFIDLIQKD